MDKDRFKDRLSKLSILGRHIEKYINICLFVMGLTLAGHIFITIYYGYIDEKTNGQFVDNFYLVLYYVAVLLDSICLTFLILSKLKKIGSLRMAIFLHTHVFFTFVVSTMLAILDLKVGTSPMVILNITLVISGLLVVEPIFFTILSILSMAAVLIFNGIYKYPFFEGNGELVDFVTYFLLVIVASYRHYRVTITEHKSKARLEQLTYYDDLTGLLNERSYMLTVDEINERLAKKQQLEYGIVVMDVNNLKATNDKYGHRYGCHLIVKTGHMLPDTFKNSRCFHVGGDEFIVILLDDDLKNYEKLMEEFDAKFRFSHIDFEGKDLIFSVARGISIYKEGQEYKDTFNIADKAMYDNKVAIKKEYNLASR